MINNLVPEHHVTIHVEDADGVKETIPGIIFALTEQVVVIDHDDGGKATIPIEEIFKVSRPKKLSQTEIDARTKTREDAIQLIQREAQAASKKAIAKVVGRKPRKGGETKLSKARTLMATNPTLTKEQYIELFEKELEMTPRGASTYFYMAKKKA